MELTAKENLDRSTANNAGILSRVALNDNKAGMGGLDKEKINKIIMEASKGSRFYENEQKREEQVNQRIEKMLQQKAQVTEHLRKIRQQQVDRLRIELEKNRDLSRTIIHIDMDAFYAAVEMKDNPELKDKPMAVGSKSMLSTSNYHARKYGVRAAMPGFIAKKLCPNLIIVPTNFDKYRSVSKQVQEILGDYDPNFVAVSLDEAYLDITEHLEQRQNWPEHKRTYYCHGEENENMDNLQPSNEDSGATSPLLFKDSPPMLSQLEPVHCAVQQTKEPIVFGVTAEEAVKEMRFRIEQTTKLTASAGIAPNMMLSKVCSEVNKPNGQYQIPADSSAVMDFVKNLPIRKVPGIGKVTEKMLNALGITTCTELLQQGALLSILFSESAWYNFLRISLGLSETRVERDGDRKSMSTERTFGEISKASEQYSLCRELCRDLEEDLRKEGLRGRTVTLKLKSINFEVKTRACTVPSAISKEEELYAVASEILKTEIDNMHPQPLRLRLMGLRISGFIHQGEKKSNQQSIINFFHTGKSDSPVCSSDSEGIDLKNQTELVETAKKESFFNKKRQQNDQRSFFGQVLEVKQGKCKPVITPSACTMDEMQLKSSGLTPALKVTRICPKCFKRLSISTSEKLKNQIDHCICPTEEAITSKTSCTITRDTSSLENYLENEKNMDLNELNGTEYQENLSQTYLRNTEMDLHEKLERNSLDGELSFTNSTFPIKQSDHQIYLKDHMQLVYRSPRTLKPIKHKAILDEENEFSNHTIEMSAEITHATQKKLQFDLTESNTSRLNQPSFSQLDLSRQGAQQQSDQVDRHSRSKEERLSSQSEEPIGLVCPICNIRQETTDLSLFNKHVDICLNQGVIQELTERSMQPVSTDCTSNGVGLSGFERRSSNSFVRTKRSGSASQQSTTKKVRCKSSINTIDRFFK
ncbi:DNA polymerase kappa isoform X1 [Narcine bancroftii]|uniref:DNA polymerase kappa isoform X1 n=1 Tax=Narcine bancroftii TaxID=1343680 RepID=UPI0038311BDD